MSEAMFPTVPFVAEVFVLPVLTVLDFPDAALAPFVSFRPVFMHRSIRVNNSRQ